MFHKLNKIIIWKIVCLKKKGVFLEEKQLARIGSYLHPAYRWVPLRCRGSSLSAGTAVLVERDFRSHNSVYFLLFSRYARLCRFMHCVSFIVKSK